MKKQIPLLSLSLCLLVLTTCKTPQTHNSLTAYQDIDGVADFAPALWLAKNTYKGSFSDDYNSFYFFRKTAANQEKYLPYVAHYKAGKWQEPSIPEYYKKQHSYTYQLKIPKQNKLLFIADKAVAADTTKNPNYNFWETLITQDKFSSPKEIGYNNLIYHYNSQPCVTNTGTIYFTSDLPDWSQTLSYKMSPGTEGYREPERFEPVNAWRENTNWKVYEFCMAPEEDYMIVCIQDVSEASQLNTDLFISYRLNNSWTTPKKLSEEINTLQTENFPTITADGKYLIFTRAFSEFKLISTEAIRK